jgi:hypothetical protein
MAMQGGFGLQVKINTGSLTAIASVIDCEFPEQEKILDEFWTHDATSGYQRRVASGARDLKPFKMELAWDDAQATHAAILTNLAADVVVGFSIQDPDGQEVIAFNAHCSNIKRISEVDKALRAEVTVSPDAAPTIT